MPLESLLVSRDPQVIRVLRPALEKLAIEVEVCRGADSGSEILASEKFDAVIVDCDDLHGGLGVLETLRGTTSNRNSVTFAILNGHTTTREAFQMGANFVLQKPISPVNAARCFSAAIGLMSRERRRYFRQPVEMPVTLVFGEGQELKATATNLSEGVWQFSSAASFLRAASPRLFSDCLAAKCRSKPKPRLHGLMERDALAYVSSRCPKPRVSNWTAG
jgi:DNA-binding response OmpR family regulator